MKSIIFRRNNLILLPMKQLLSGIILILLITWSCQYSKSVDDSYIVNVRDIISKDKAISLNDDIKKLNIFS